MNVSVMKERDFCCGTFLPIMLLKSASITIIFLYSASAFSVCSSHLGSRQSLDQDVNGLKHLVNSYLNSIQEGDQPDDDNPFNGTWRRESSQCVDGNQNERDKYVDEDVNLLRFNTQTLTYVDTFMIGECEARSSGKFSLSGKDPAQVEFNRTESHDCAAPSGGSSGTARGSTLMKKSKFRFRDGKLREMTDIECTGHPGFHGEFVWVRPPTS